jgi:hypothetical protein
VKEMQLEMKKMQVEKRNKVEMERMEMNKLEKKAENKDSILIIL